MDSLDSSVLRDRVHKLEGGDVIKILPMIDRNGNIIWYREHFCVFIHNQLIYDCSDKNYLRRISSTLYSNGDKNLPVQVRYAYNIYFGGEIRIMNFPISLQSIITNNPGLLDVSSNNQLFLVKDEAYGGIFSDWSKSYVSEKSWDFPVSDINSKEEWYSYIKTNQPDFANHIESNNIFVHKEKLVRYLGKDMLGDLISDDRQKKLDKLGI